jgi:hypothetical protein
VFEDADHVGGQTPVGLAPQVGDVHGDAATGFEFAGAFGEHLGQHLEILEVRRRNPVPFELLFVLLPGEIRRRGHDEGHRPVGDRVHVSGVSAYERFGDRFGRQDGVLDRQLR